MQQLQVIRLGTDEAVGFAAEELARYLGEATGEQPGVKAADAAPAVEPGGLWVGTFADFGDGLRHWPETGDAALDDAVFIETSGSAGIIAGSNPGSTLFAVYRYLRELGFRWVSPGREGDRVPAVSVEATAVRVAETASYRHRGICIEGAVSYENVRDVVDWSAKNGFNTYFTQFREAHTFFNRWYTHMKNPFLEPEPFPVERAREFKAWLTREIGKRGMVFHDVGHGWTCEPFGIPGLGWNDYEEPLSGEVTGYLAEVNGERKLWRKIPMNTNLCYSNPEVRRIVTDDIVQYARQHPEVDVIHFWLADGSNNQCECEECRKGRPSDFYVKMLNELDAKLTSEGLPARIVFLIYVDLLWPPEHEVIKNKERFILMFAPITRTYSRAFEAEEALPELPPYDRNKLEFPASVEANVAFLRAWQQMFDGDSFDFDYHYMWDHLKDPGYYAIARTLHRDVVNLADIGLNGLVSCQAQRTFLPHGLGMCLMGQALWDRTTDFDAFADDFFGAAFGPDGKATRAYMATLSALFDPPYLRGEKDSVSEESAAKFDSIPDAIERFRPVIQRNLGCDDPNLAQAWRYLDIHADMAAQLARALALRARGQNAEAHERWVALSEFVQKREMDVQPVLDVFEYVAILERLFPEPGA